MRDYYSVRWCDGVVKMIDQRLLPESEVYREYVQSSDVAKAISQMVVRGAPAIGIAAGFGLALSAFHSKANSFEELFNEIEISAQQLRISRPTAVNLFSAIDRMMKLLENATEMSFDQIKQQIVDEAKKIADEDIAMNNQIAKNGQQFIPDSANLIHHCNTGALATGGYGTALGVIRYAHEIGKKIHVYLDETRPRLQGARLTAWELKQLDIPHTVIVDGASGYFMQKMKIDACLVGCDRIVANGDVANKIGTYNLAIAAKAHQVPFYSIGPTTTIDLFTAHGKDIPIEERPASEITVIGNLQIIPDSTHVANPAFDITPARYITAIITNSGVAFPPYKKTLPMLMKEVRN